MFMKQGLAIGILFAILLFIVAYNNNMSAGIALLCSIIGGLVLGGGIWLYNAQYKKQ